MDDPHNLQRFLDAQQPVYEQVCTELRGGRKRSHWMWFIFPQLTGLGHSAMAQHYAIASLAEARAYLTHPVLGARLRECSRLVTEVQDRSADEIFGSPDNMKFRSSMTLFSIAANDGYALDNCIFDLCLRQHFHGQPDVMTQQLLGQT